MGKYYSEHELLNNMYDIVDEDGCILTVLDKDTLKTLPPLMPVRQPVHAHKCIATSKSGLTMFFECSNCRKAIDYSDVYFKYCGAKMDEAEIVGKRMIDGLIDGMGNNVKSVGQQFCNGEE